jgi:hypothetical protein
MIASLCFFFLGVALATHVSSLNVAMHPFVAGFEPSQQLLLVVGNVYGEMSVSFQ